MHDPGTDLDTYEIPGVRAYAAIADAPPPPPGARSPTSRSYCGLLRAIEHALRETGVWRDSARVVEYQRLAKEYLREDSKALDSPDVRIVVGARRDEAPA